MPRGRTISAIIPTCHRPELVLRAVRSALGQTLPPDEVIVVIDGPDEPTAQSLKTINDHRVRIIALDENVGNASARNIGVSQAKNDWIAFLDDDDEWLANKLEVQISVAMGSSLRACVRSPDLL